MSPDPNTHPLNSLGFAKAVKDTRVVVAMSGGVDSSVVAALLKDQGYEVIGITLQLYDAGEKMGAKGAEAAAPSCIQNTPPPTSQTPPAKTSKTCCAGADIADARQVAARINIPHYVLDYESAFRQSVIDDFAESYLQGQTPIPCVRCNQKVKFHDLLKTARDLGADCLATGHYVQHIMGADGAELHAGADSSRDQSYFLFATTQDQLDYLRFPLGGMDKNETRKLAAHYGLAVADKPDSQDICFVPNGRYADVVAKLRPEAIKSGAIIDTNGTVLGTHEGIIHFTIGQRKGLNLQMRSGENRDPYYVIGLNAERREVIVGPHHLLAADGLLLKELNFLTDPKNLIDQPVQVKYRSTMTSLHATLQLAGADSVQVNFAEPQYGIAAGQACAIYDKSGRHVLGGGWIKAAISTKNSNKNTETVQNAVA